jgi:Fur family ferric uptake transcriptional regulator
MKNREIVLNNNDELKKVGLKVTLPRLKILQILENAKAHHFSAEDLYRVLLESGDDIGLATVYRVLTQFEEAGLVMRHHFEGGQSVFELNQGAHHDHLVCVKCDAVEEFIDEVIEKRQEEIANQAGYSMTDHSLNIYGICAKCQKKG